MTDDSHGDFETLTAGRPEALADASDGVAGGEITTTALLALEPGCQPLVEDLRP